MGIYVHYSTKEFFLNFKNLIFTLKLTILESFSLKGYLQRLLANRWEFWAKLFKREKE